MPKVQIDSKGGLNLTDLDPEAWKKTLRRILINGEPLSGKTTSLLTFPGPRHIVAAHGELGTSSIREDENTKVWVFEFIEGVTNYARAWAAMNTIIAEIIAGKHGPVTTLGLDGLHVFYKVMMKAKGWTPDTDSKAFSSYHDAFTNFIMPLVAGPIRYIVGTCYDGSEALEVGSKETALWPDLPGKMSKQIMGMFPVVLHSKRTGVGDAEQYFWELKATGKMRGVGVHIPLEFRGNIPPHCKPSWEMLEPVLLGSAAPVVKSLTK